MTQNIIAALSELILDTPELISFVQVWSQEKRVARVFAIELPEKLANTATNQIVAFSDSLHLPAITILTAGSRTKDLRVYQNTIYGVFVWARSFSDANNHAELLKRKIHAVKGDLNNTRYAAIQYIGGDLDLKDSVANRVCRHFEISTVVLT